MAKNVFLNKVKVNFWNLFVEEICHFQNSYAKKPLRRLAKNNDISGWVEIETTVKKYLYNGCL